MRRHLVAIGAVALLQQTVPARAAQSPTSVTVTTYVAGTPSPISTMLAAWADAKSGKQLTSTGNAAPGTVTVVTAQWTGTRKISNRGALITLEHGAAWQGTGQLLSQSYTVEYQRAGRWHRVKSHVRIVPDGAPPPTPLDQNGWYAEPYELPSLAGRTVPVRVRIRLSFDQPAVQITDWFTVDR